MVEVKWMTFLLIVLATLPIVGLPWSVSPPSSTGTSKSYPPAQGPTTTGFICECSCKRNVQMQNLTLTTIGSIVEHIDTKMQSQPANRIYTPTTGRFLFQRAAGTAGEAPPMRCLAELPVSN